MSVAMIENIEKDIVEFENEIINNNEKIEINNGKLLDKAFARKCWTILSIPFGVLTLANVYFLFYDINDFINALPISFYLFASILFVFSLFVVLRVLNVKKSRLIDEEKESLEQLNKEIRESIDSNRERINYINRQVDLNEEAVKLVGDIEVSASNLPITLGNVAYLLTEAKSCYQKSQFAPFWDKIEQTMVEINQYYATVEQIKENTSRYHNLAVEYDSNYGQLIKFPIGENIIQPLSIINELESKMESIISPAQSDINFASIYEMRRTNQILVAGFNNLSSAINGLSETLSYQLNDLGSNLSNLGSILIDTQGSIESTGQQQAQLLNTSNNLQRNMANDINKIRREYTGTLF